MDQIPRTGWGEIDIFSAGHGQQMDDIADSHAMRKVGFGQDIDLETIIQRVGELPDMTQETALISAMPVPVY